MKRKEHKYAAYIFLLLSIFPFFSDELNKIIFVLLISVFQYYLYQEHKERGKE